jgi:F-type H+-transporting ATPase subunit b
MQRFCKPALVVASGMIAAASAFAAPETGEHGAEGAEHGAGAAHTGGGFFDGLIYSLTDPVTHVAFLAFAAFLAIAWRMGALKTVFGALDGRAEKIRNELENAQSLRDQAAALLAQAERKSQEADREAEGLLEQARADAQRIVEDARRDMSEKMARREAQAEQRIARAEVEATNEVRRAAADAATEAVRRVLASGKGDDAFERALGEIEKALK